MRSEQEIRADRAIVMPYLARFEWPHPAAPRLLEDVEPLLDAYLGVVQQRAEARHAVIALEFNRNFWRQQAEEADTEIASSKAAAVAAETERDRLRLKLGDCATLCQEIAAKRDHAEDALNRIRKLADHELAIGMTLSPVSPQRYGRAEFAQQVANLLAVGAAVVGAPQDGSEFEISGLAQEELHGPLGPPHYASPAGVVGVPVEPPTRIQCPNCHGTGEANLMGYLCLTCDAKGFVDRPVLGVTPPTEIGGDNA